MSEKLRLLVIEDDPEIIALLTEMLEVEGFDVQSAENASDGLRAAYRGRPDLILLDVMMPGMDGFETCERLRELTDAPVLLITGKATDAKDIARGFAVGADDYVLKPFTRAELVSRIYARLRRTKPSVSDRAILAPAPDVVLDLHRRQLVLGERTIYLSPQEFRVLELLIRNAGHVLSAEAIFARAWGQDSSADPGVVKQYIYRLRQRIEPDPSTPRYIHSVRGGGYCFEVPTQRTS